MPPPNTDDPPKTLRLALAEVGVPPSPMLPNKPAPNPWLVFGAEEVGAFTDVCPNVDTPNSGLIAVVAGAAPCPKTLPGNNPLGVPPLDCPNTEDEPKDEVGCTPLA